MGKILYEDLSYKLRGCFFEVYNELGLGHKEQIYQEALKISFEEKGLNFIEKKRLKIKFKDKEIGSTNPTL